jgi:hypothetical protein
MQDRKRRNIEQGTRKEEYGMGENDQCSIRKEGMDMCEKM